MHQQYHRNILRKKSKHNNTYNILCRTAQDPMPQMQQ
jgi:hypothetical protein